VIGWELSRQLSVPGSGCCGCCGGCDASIVFWYVCKARSLIVDFEGLIRGRFMDSASSGVSSVVCKALSLGSMVTFNELRNAVAGMLH
jgi:hypothetical protein